MRTSFYTKKSLKKIKKKVLVFPCGSEIGLEIFHSLKWSTFYELYGASSVSSNHGKYVYKHYIEKIPYVHSNNFINELNKVVTQYKIDYIFPAHDSVVLKLAQNQDKIKAQIIGSPYSTCKICRSKKSTYQLFRNKILTPKIYSLNNEKLTYPLFLKPEIGQGSKGTNIVNSKQEIRFFLKKDPSLLILEYLPGAEYTIDCFTDSKGCLLFVGGRERIRISNGISVNSKPIIDKEFEEIANFINNTLKFRGAWFFQLKKNINNKLCLVEIAPRIAGTMCLYRNLGINFALLSLFDVEGIKVKVIPNKFNIEVDRALFSRYKTSLIYKHVYVDLDDTLIINKKINPLLIAFLYQCRNNKIALHLITKNNNNIKNKLEKYHIIEMFDEIILVQKDQNKSEFIKKNPSIFIDDSFNERSEVFSKLNIPIFDIGSIDCLINWND